MPHYCNLGEMKNESGEALNYEIRKLASVFAVKISEIIKDYSIYKEVEKILHSPKTLLYFQVIIRREIFPIIHDLCVIRWRIRNNQLLKNDERTVFLPRFGIYPLLVRVLEGEGLPARIVGGKSNKLLSYKTEFHALSKNILDIYIKWRYSGDFNGFLNGKSNITLEYAEGLDFNRRSDIIWFPKSGIDPQQIIIYFNGPDNSTSKPVTEEVLARIEGLGMKWVCLNPGSVARKKVPVWYPSLKNDEQIRILRKPHGQIEEWIYQKAAVLLKEVNYWSAFYKEFNIKLNFVIGEGVPQYISQSIAFDVKGEKGGFLVGKQRSECFFPSEALLGYHPKDIFFVWNKRVKNYVTQNLNQISSYVVAGYPNDLSFERKIMESVRPKLSSKLNGVGFVIALFDNVHGPQLHFSTEMMENFYLVFLNWLLEDETLGIIIKSKKPLVLNNLPKVLPVLARAEGTGRCLRLGNEFGRMAFDAAAASDMAVGIGISSAVIEAIIAGRRGLHCDLTNLLSHEFYQWGYERIIFDNLIRMIDALKRYKADKKSIPSLGDWTPFLDKLDPYRDGCAGERIGTYLRWCLEGFDMNLNRETVLRQANEKYAKMWGANNIYANA